MGRQHPGGGDPKRQSGSKEKFFIADSFGFASNGELHNVSSYLKSHGGFELEMVGGSSFVCLAWSILSASHPESNRDPVRTCLF